MEISKTESPTESFCRSTRRVRTRNKSIVKLNETKDQENVINTSLEQINADGTITDEVKKSNTIDSIVHATAVNLNSSTPRRKKDPLANLYSNLSPKYIGFTTPTNKLNSSNEERTRSLRRRHNNSLIADIDTSEEKEVDITFTPNNEGTVGFVRRTPKSRSSQITPDNSVQRKKFVSPIDKLLIKNGAVMEFNNNLPLEDNSDMNLRNKELLISGKCKHDLDEMELGVKKLENDEKEQNNESASTSTDNVDIENEGKEDEDSVSISTEIANQMEEIEADDEVEDEVESVISKDSDVSNDDITINEPSNNGNDNSQSSHGANDNSQSSHGANDNSQSSHDENDNSQSSHDENDNGQSSHDENDNGQYSHDENDNSQSSHDENDNSQSSHDEIIENVEKLQNEECLQTDLNETNPEMEEDVILLEEENELLQIPNHVENGENVTLKKEIVDNAHIKEEILEDKSESSIIIVPDGDYIKDLENTEHNKCTLVKVEFESIENASNNEFVVDTSAPANSPSAISMDSAKGSSINNEVSWISFSTGDLYWGQIYNYCFWPCMICPDPDGKTITTEEVGRSGDQTVFVHVRFFADNGRRNWVKRENLMPYSGIENYQERIVEVREKYGTKSAKYKLYVPTKKKEQVWYEAVNEANIVAEVPYSDRLAKFYEIFEKSKAFQKLEKQRRKSMYISVNSGTGCDIDSFYDSNDNTSILALAAAIKNKRERSISPYSPAYSPIKPVASKRRKLSGDQELASVSTSGAVVSAKTEENPTNESSLGQPNSSTSTSSISNSLNDLDIFNGLEFRKFYAVMKDFVMEQNRNDKLEKSLVVAVRNIWALRQLGRRQLESKLGQSLTELEPSPSLALTNVRSTGEGSVKRLSSRLKSITVRKSLMAQSYQYTPERSVTPNPLPKEDVKKVKKPINRPILEVIDDIFDLDTKYLFKGIYREPVCKYCFKPGGDLKKCVNNCTYWLHKECLSKDFNKQKRRGNKTLNGSETNNNNNTLSGSQSSSLVNLTEVEDISHVTGDSDGVAADVICKECANKEPAKCMVCYNTDSKNDDDPLVKCRMAQCERAFHPSCCKYWPQAKITISKNHIEAFRCPSHVCHTCVSDDPKGKFQHLSSAKLTKCVKCPATFHTDSTCIPAGSQILTAAHIICPRHSSTKHDMTVNVNWCFICVGGGQLMCCETCPTAVHANCLKIPIAANEGYICEECESGRMPLYGEMVWAKFNQFRWWPAIILPPTEIPKNIARKTHNPSDFVVRFFGTHDHGWISRRRVYLYLEGDSSEPPKSRSSLDLSYNKGVEEAKEVYEIIKNKKVQQRNSNENKEKLHPQPYVRIRANRPVPPVKLHIDIESVSKCECDPREENPCGPDTNCLNRVLYHECNPKLCPAGERCQNQMFESRVSPRLDVVYMKERGFGLVCREPIKAGSFVIEYVGEIINDDEFQARMQQKSRDRDENFYFLSVEKEYIIDAGPKGNLARFMNHSCDPNCETQKWSVNSLNRVGLFAIKDIPQNTELTFNYHWDDLLGNEKKTCYCGARTCAGQIGGKIRELETAKEPTAVNRKSKSKTKRKGNKNLLNRGHKNKLVSKLKLKAKSTTLSKKRAVADAVSAILKTSTTDTEGKIIIEEPEENKEASTSRLLESPDIFS